VRLRVLTGTFVLFSIVLMLGYPWLLGPKPPSTTRYPGYLLNSLLYIVAVVGSLVAAGVCSLLILRQAKEEYRRDKEQLMRSLLEGSLRDHGRKPEEPE